MKYSRVISLVIAMGLLLTLVAGCGQNGSQPSASGQTQSEQTNEPVNLSIFAYSADAETPGFQELLDDYSELSGNTIEFVTLPGSIEESYRKIDVALMSGDK